MISFHFVPSFAQRLLILAETVGTLRGCGYSQRLWVLSEAVKTLWDFPHSPRLNNLTETASVSRAEIEFTLQDCEHSPRVYSLYRIVGTLWATVHSPRQCFTLRECARGEPWHLRRCSKLGIMAIFSFEGANRERDRSEAVQCAQAKAGCSDNCALSEKANWRKPVFH